MKALLVNGEFAPEALPGLGASAAYACRYVAESPIARLYTFTVKPEVLRELEQAMDRYLGSVIDRKFKSLEILRMLEGEKR